MRKRKPEDEDFQPRQGHSGVKPWPVESLPGPSAVPPQDISRWNDEELMARCLRVEGAFQELMSRYERSIFLLAISMLNSRADAEEVVQETFLAIYKNQERFNPELSFTSWLYTIAANQCKNVLRRRKRKVLSLDAEGVPEVGARIESDPSVLYENDVCRQKLAEALASLKPKYSVVLVLRYAEGCSYEEIGSQLKLSNKAVDTRLYRAKKQLRQKLEQLGVKQNPW